MKNSTVAIIKQVLAADAEVSPEQASAVLRLLTTPQPTDADEDVLLTLKETCATLKCSRQTVWRLVADGRLRSVQVRGLRRFRRSDIRTLVAAHDGHGERTNSDARANDNQKQTN